jgi:hypothetical protein
LEAQHPSWPPLTPLVRHLTIYLSVADLLQVHCNSVQSYRECCLGSQPPRHTFIIPVFRRTLGFSSIWCVLRPQYIDWRSSSNNRSRSCSALFHLCLLVRMNLVPSACEAAHTGCIMHTLYIFTIVDYGKPLSHLKTDPIPKSLGATTFFTGILAACGAVHSCSMTFSDSTN